MKIENENILGLRRGILELRPSINLNYYITEFPKSSNQDNIRSFIRMDDSLFFRIRDGYKKARVRDKIKSLNPDRYISINEDSIVYFNSCFDLPEEYKKVVKQGYSGNICVFPLVMGPLYFEEVLIFEREEKTLVLNHARTPECVGLTFPDWYEKNYKFNVNNQIRFRNSFLKNYTLTFSGYIIGSSYIHSHHLNIIAMNSGRYTSEAEVVELACKDRPTLNKTEFIHIKELIESKDTDSVKHALNIICSYKYTKHSFTLSNMLLKLDRKVLKELSQECKYIWNCWAYAHRNTFEVSYEDLLISEDTIKEIGYTDSNKYSSSVSLE